jgi:hypothetical protein
MRDRSARLKTVVKYIFASMAAVAVGATFAMIFGLVAMVLKNALRMEALGWGVAASATAFFFIWIPTSIVPRDKIFPWVLLLAGGLWCKAIVMDDLYGERPFSLESISIVGAALLVGFLAAALRCRKAGTLESQHVISSADDEHPRLPNS